jgi:hypothetical protein
MDNNAFGTATAPSQDNQVSTPPVGGQLQDPNQQFAAVELQRAIKGGGSWFYWIAGLTLVNTIAALAGTDWRFLLGLGITQVADYIASDLGAAGRVAAFVIDALAIAYFMLMGVFANKFHKWAFVFGMVAFGLDTGISVLGKDVIGVVFHIYALWCIYRGYSKIQPLRDLNEFGVTAGA